MHFIENDDFAIGILCRRLHVDSKVISAEALKSDIQEITNSIQMNKYSSLTIPFRNPETEVVMAWTEFEFTTCGRVGSQGPTLEQCQQVTNYFWMSKISKTKKLKRTMKP